MLSVVDTPAFLPCPAPFNLAAHVLSRAGVEPGKIALQVLRGDDVQAMDYGTLEAAVRGAATGLLRRGLNPGDRVLLRLGNAASFPIAFLGAITAGIVPVPTSSQLTGPEVQRLIDRVAPTLIIAEAGLALPDCGEPDCGVPVLATTDLMGFAVLPPAKYATGDPDRLAYVTFTSGSSGSPRAVAHAHRAVWARRMMRAGWHDIGAEDRVLHVGALNWSFTLGTGLLDPWSVGATAMILGEGATHVGLDQLLLRHGVTVFAAVPGVFRRLLAQGGAMSFPTLRHALSAGEKLPDATRHAWATATGTAIHEALGMTECSTFISGSPDRPAGPGETGFAQPGRRIAVLGQDGQPVPRGTPGILAVHRDDPGLFLGYLGQPQESAAQYRGEWFLTGDCVGMAANDAVTYLGRDDDMLNAGGFRLSPAEVEAAFAGLADCAAVEVTVKADTSVVALFHASETSEDDLRRRAEATLAPYKRPRLYVMLQTLPRTATGKTDRRRLREEWTTRI